MKHILLAAALSGTALAGAANAQTSAPPPAPIAKHGPGAADTNRDGIVTRAEATAAADAMFARRDTNHDGKLTSDERRGRRGADKPDITRDQFRARAAQRFDRADTNKDGTLDASERQNMRAARHGGRGRGGHGGPLGMMMRADANRDGVLTRAEAVAATNAMFDRLDTNRDGRIDQAERDAMRSPTKMPKAPGTSPLANPSS